MKQESEQKSNQKNDSSEELYTRLQNTGSVTINKNGKNIFCLTIIGEIEGHMSLSEQTKTTKYEHMIPLIVSIEESDQIDGMLMILNTVGGDVEAGLAIAELVAGMQKPTASFVIGGGHSIGVPLAVSARRSFIAPSATMTIHPVRMNGLVVGVPQMMNHFARMQERITDFVADHSKMPAKRFTELLMNTGELVTDMGSVLDGKMAVSEGLIDSLGTLSEVLDYLYGEIK